MLSHDVLDMPGLFAAQMFHARRDVLETRTPQHGFDFSAVVDPQDMQVLIILRRIEAGEIKISGALDEEALE